MNLCWKITMIKGGIFIGYSDPNIDSPLKKDNEPIFCKILAIMAASQTLCEFQT